MYRVVKYIFILSLILAISASISLFQKRTYVKGKYGEKCYTLENMNKNIKYPIYFNNLNSCLNSL
mgnify:CR=1 FL=1